MECVFWILCSMFLILKGSKATHPCPSPPCLFYTDRTAVKAFQLSHGSSQSTVLSNLYRAAAITVDVRRNLLFWSDRKRDVIQCLNLTSGRTQDIVTDDVGSVRDLAVDWETGLLYWTDYGKKHISVVTYDGAKRKTLINAGVLKPHGIAVDPRNGLLFWTDLGSKPRIQKATLSGHNQTTIVDLNPLGQRWPHGITIDYSNNRLYWIDSYMDQIMSVDFNGKNSILHHSDFNFHAYSLDMYGNLLYWSDSVGRSTTIRTVSKSGSVGHGGSYYDVGYSTDMGIAIYHKSRQPRGNLSCLPANHNCQYLCLLSPRGSQCACPDGKILDKDGKSCKDSSKSILFTESGKVRYIFQIPLDVPQPVKKRLPLYNLGEPNAIDVDPVDKRVYWSESWQPSISRAFLNGTSQQQILRLVRTPDGLAVDWVGGNIYWTDREANKIEVAKLDGKYRKTLIFKNLERPTNVIVDLRKGYLYWGSAGGNLTPKVEQADMTGYNRRVLANLSHPARPTGLAISDNRLYWIDEYHKVLQYVDRVTPGGVVTLHLSPRLSNPSVLASLGGSLYLLDSGQSSNDGNLVKIDKNTGKILQILNWFLDQPLGISAVDFNSTLTLDSHPCTINNGWCTHLCLVDPTGYKCACPNISTPGRPCLTVPNRPNITTSPSSPIPIPITPTSKQETSTIAPTTEEHTIGSTTIPKTTTIPLTTTTTKTTATIPLTTTMITKTIPLTTTMTTKTTITPSTTTKTKQSTIVTTQKPQTSSTPTPNPCLSNPCDNKAKCVQTQDNQDGFACQCEEGFASKLCDVFYGENKVEITFKMKLEDWKTPEFQAGMAKIVNEYCSKNDCKPKTKRRRRSSGPLYFTPDDIIVAGDPKAVSNGIKVRVVILEPQQENPSGPRKPMSESLLCVIMRDTKETRSSVLKGYNIMALNGEKEPKCVGGAGTAGKSKGNRSGASSSSSVLAGGIIVGLCILVLVLIVFFIYRKRKQRRQMEENESRSHATFNNPGFTEDQGADTLLSNPTYEEIGPELRDEVLGLSTSLPWQEEFRGATNPVYYEVDRGSAAGAAHAPTRAPVELEEDKLKEKMRVDLKPEGNGNHDNSRNGGNHGNGENDGENEERYVEIPANHKTIKQPDYSSIPAGRFKPKVERTEPEPEYASIPTVRFKQKVDRQKSDYSSIPAGPIKAKAKTDEKPSCVDRSSDSDDRYEGGNLSEAKKSNQNKRPRIAPPPEDPTLNGIYEYPDGTVEGSKDKRIYVNADEINGSPLKDDSNKHNVNADIIKELNDGEITAKNGKRKKPSLNKQAQGHGGNNDQKGQKEREIKDHENGRAPSKRRYQLEERVTSDEAIS